MTNVPVHKNTPLTNILKTDTSLHLLQFWKKNVLIELLQAMSNNNGQGYFHHYDEYIGSVVSWFICW